MRKLPLLSKALRRILAGLEIAYDYLDDVKGELFFRAKALKDGEIAGYLDGGLHQGVVAVKYIKVDPKHKRQGVGKQLLLSLLSEFPEGKIDMGMMTGDGLALWNSVKNQIPEKNIYDPSPSRLKESVILEIEKIDAKMGKFLRDLCRFGYEKGWEKLGDGWKEVDWDANDIARIAEYIQGSQMEEGIADIPEYVLDDLRKLGIGDVSKYLTKQTH